MILRIQTLWLFISAFCAALLLKGGFISFTDMTNDKYLVGFAGISKLMGSDYNVIEGSIGLPVVIILIIIISVVALLLYKKRKMQKILCLTVIALSVCFIIIEVYYTYRVTNIYIAVLVPGIKMFLPVISFVAAILAYRGISNDERIIKSYDRMR